MCVLTTLCLPLLLILLWFLLCVFFPFLGPHSRHMEVPRLEVESELQPSAYTTDTTTWDPSCICHLCRSLRQRQILNLLSEARDRTSILMDTSHVLNLLGHSGISLLCVFSCGKSFLFTCRLFSQTVVMQVAVSLVCPEAGIRGISCH